MDSSEDRRGSLQAAFVLATAGLVWLAYRNRAHFHPLVFVPLIAGGLIGALRAPGLSSAVDDLERRLREGHDEATADGRKFGAQCRRGFLAIILAVWRCTAWISDLHARAAARAAGLLFIAGFAIVVLAEVLFVVVVIVVLALALLLALWLYTVLEGGSTKRKKQTPRRRTSGTYRAKYAASGAAPPKADAPAHGQSDAGENPTRQIPAGGSGDGSDPPPRGN